MANSLKDHIRFVGALHMPLSEGWGVREGGKDSRRVVEGVC